MCNLFFSYDSSTDGSRPPTPLAPGEEMEGRASVASRRFTPAPPAIPEEHPMDVAEEPPPLQDQTTLLHDEEESFALAPVDASALKGSHGVPKITNIIISSLTKMYKQKL